MFRFQQTGKGLRQIRKKIHIFTLSKFLKLAYPTHCHLFVNYKYSEWCLWSLSSTREDFLFYSNGNYGEVKLIFNTGLTETHILTFKSFWLTGEMTQQ